MGVSGISSGFLELSRTSGQVSHVLLTRSPLDLPQCCHWLDLARLACVRHAASVRPEPGSNSPSRSLELRFPKEGEPRKSKSRCHQRKGDTNWHSSGISPRYDPRLLSVVCLLKGIDLELPHTFASERTAARTRLFGILSSVVKKRRSPLG